MVLGLALGGIVLLVLFLFTRDGMQPDRKPRNTPKSNVAATQAKPAPERKVMVVKQERKVSNKAKRRERILKRWAKMTPEQRKEFMKKHPNFKPPAQTPATAGAKPASSAPSKTDKTKAAAQPTTTTKQKTTTSTTTTKTQQPAKTTTQQKAN